MCIRDRSKYRMVLVANSRTRAEHLAKDLQEYELPAVVTELSLIHI